MSNVKANTKKPKRDKYTWLYVYYNIRITTLGLPLVFHRNGCFILGPGFVEPTSRTSTSIEYVVSGFNWKTVNSKFFTLEPCHIVYFAG